MKKSELNRRYAGIRSLQQLRIEREKLSWMIENQEKALREDYNEFRSMLSWSYISGVAMEALGSVSTVVNGIVSGAQMIFSLFRGDSGGKRRQIRKKNPRM